MILFRIVQGVGSAVMSAISGALVVREFPLAERGRVLGITLFGCLRGPDGGTGGRRCPRAAPGMAVNLLRQRADRAVTVLLSLVYLRSERMPRTDARFDFPGAISLTSFLVTLLLALSGLEIYLWELILLVVACFASFITFVLLERREGISPLIDLRLFTQNRLFAAGNVTALMNYTTASGVVLVLSLYLQDVLGVLARSCRPDPARAARGHGPDRPRRGSALRQNPPGILTRDRHAGQGDRFPPALPPRSLFFERVDLGAAHTRRVRAHALLLAQLQLRDELCATRTDRAGVRDAGDGEDDRAVVGVAVLGGVVAASMPPGGCSRR